MRPCSFQTTRSPTRGLLRLVGAVAVEPVVVTSSSTLATDALDKARLLVDAIYKSGAVEAVRTRCAKTKARAQVAPGEMDDATCLATLAHRKCVSVRRCRHLNGDRREGQQPG